MINSSVGEHHAGIVPLVANVAQIENEIVGEALIALKHEELKEMNILSVGHRLTILKGVYDVKVRQEIPIESDHYIPPCKVPSLRIPSSMTDPFQLPMPTQTTSHPVKRTIIDWSSRS